MRGWESPFGKGEEGGDGTFIREVCLAESLSEEFFLGFYRGNIDEGKEENVDGKKDVRQAGKEAQTQTDEKAAEIKGVSTIGVRTAGGEELIFDYVTCREQANSLSDKDQAYPYQKPITGGLGEEEANQREDKVKEGSFLGDIVQDSQFCITISLTKLAVFLNAPLLPRFAFISLNSRSCFPLSSSSVRS